MPTVGSRRGPTKGDQRERALLDAARELLRRKPLQQVTIDELAAGAGIARSGFYFYFESKQAVLAALCDEIMGESNRDMAGWFAAQGPARRELRDALAGSLARWHTDGRWLSEAFVNPDPGPEIEQIRERISTEGCDRLTARIERDVAAGLSTVTAPRLVARMAITLKNAMFADAVRGRNGAQGTQRDDARLLDALTETTLRMIYGALPPGA